MVEARTYASAQAWKRGASASWSEAPTTLTVSRQTRSLEIDSEVCPAEDVVSYAKSPPERVLL